jgi:hypothetical protein
MREITIKRAWGTARLVFETIIFLSGAYISIYSISKGYALEDSHLTALIGIALMGAYRNPTK